MLRALELLRWVPVFVIVGLLGVFLAKRIRDRSVLLAHPIRARILSTITARPGTSISELCGELVGRWGTIHHHLQVLEAAKLIQGVVEGRTHRYFVPGIPPELAARVALLRRRRLLRVARAVLQAPGLIQRDLTRTAAVSRKILRGYVDLLVDAGLLEEVRRDRHCRYYPTEELRRVATEEGPDGPEELGPAANAFPDRARESH